MAAHRLAECAGRQRHIDASAASADGQRRLRRHERGEVERRRQIAQLRPPDVLVDDVGVPSGPALRLPGRADPHADRGHLGRARAPGSASHIHAADQPSCASRSELRIWHDREEGAVPAEHFQQQAVLQLHGAAPNTLDGTHVHRDDIAVLRCTSAEGDCQKDGCDGLIHGGILLPDSCLREGDPLLRQIINNEIGPSAQRIGFGAAFRQSTGQ